MRDQLFDGFGVGGIHLFHGRNRGRALDSGGQGFGQFHVGGVIGAVREGDVIFTGIGQHMEFVAGGAADGAGIRFHRAVVQTQAIKDGAVGLVHDLVGGSQ